MVMATVVFVKQMNSANRFVIILLQTLIIGLESVAYLGYVDVFTDQRIHASRLVSNMTTSSYLSSSSSSSIHHHIRFTPSSSSSSSSSSSFSIYHLIILLLLSTPSSYLIYLVLSSFSTSSSFSVHHHIWFTLSSPPPLPLPPLATWQCVWAPLQ